MAREIVEGLLVAPTHKTGRCSLYKSLYLWELVRLAEFNGAAPRRRTAVRDLPLRSWREEAV